MPDQYLDSDVNKIREEERKWMASSLYAAFNNRSTMPLDALKDKRLPESTIFNSVFLREAGSHLYPLLLSEAYKLTGVSKDDAVRMANEVAQHEFEHVAVTGDQVAYFGVCFFEVVDEKKRSYGLGIQPLAQIHGKISPENLREIVSNPRELSVADRKMLSGKSD